MIRDHHTIATRTAPAISRRSALGTLACCAIPASNPSALASQQAGQTSPLRFPPLDSGTFLSGEIVLLDPINRRAGLRIDCAPREDKRASEGPLHYFAMLPFGEIWFHGAPATFQDIPPGTHVQGVFFKPPQGEEATIPPPPSDLSSLVPPENHALLLEDDVSFARRTGLQWKVISLSKDTSKLMVQSLGAPRKHGPSGTLNLDFDSATRVWKNGQPVPIETITADQIISINFARAINWTENEFGTNDIWLDEASLKQATQQQLERNVRYHRMRWLPGIIESVEPFDYGGGNVAIALVGGVAPQLIEDLHKDRFERIAVAVAEPTLRTWRHRGDRTFGKLREWETAPKTTGFSGVRLHVKFTELLDHFRPGNAVRVKAESWLFISNTPEERIKSLEDRSLSRSLRLPGQVPPPTPAPSSGP